MSEPGAYTVQYDPRAMKELLKLDKPIARRIARVRVAHRRDVYRNL